MGWHGGWRANESNEPRDLIPAGRRIVGLGVDMRTNGRRREMARERVEKGGKTDRKRDDE
jgi:hypothetical protein